MVQLIGVLVFSGGFAVAMAAIVLSVAPQWDRILRLASGRVEPSFNPLSELVRAERRIAVRRWASAPVSPLPAARRMRAAA